MLRNTKDPALRPGILASGDRSSPRGRPVDHAPAGDRVMSSPLPSIRTASTRLLLGLMLLVAGFRAAEARAFDLPFEATLNESQSVMGMMRVSGPRATILSAFLVDVENLQIVGEFDLNPDTTNYVLTSFLASEPSIDNTIMMTGYPTVNQSPQPGGAPLLQQEFFAILAMTRDENGWGTLVAATGDDIDLAIEETGALETGLEANKICDLLESLPVLIEWVFKLSNNEYVHYRIYEDGGLEVVVKALDRNGCWYWKIYPTTIPDFGIRPSEIVIVAPPILIELEALPVPP